MSTAPLAELARSLEPGEAGRLAQAFAQGRPMNMVIQEVRPSRQGQVKPLLQAALPRLGGDRSLLSEVLDGFAVSAQAALSRVEAVWSGPVPDGVQGRSTRAVATDLINSAIHRVHVATYSATEHSPYVESLAAAIKRGVGVTVVVDGTQQAKAVQMLREVLGGARFLDLVPRADGQYAAMHAKLVLVDDRVALITSANFSESAADRNLEAGLIVHDPQLVQGMREHLDDLVFAGELAILP